YLHHTRTAEGFQGIVRKASAAGIAADFAVYVIGRKAREAHGPGLHLSHARAKGVFFTHGARNDGLVVHLHVFEKVLRQIAAMEANRFVGIIAVIIVPI